MARVMALYRVQILDFARARDYFPAYCVALQLNTMQKDHLYTPEEILNNRYPSVRTVTVTPNHDPDFGAMGWESLRGLVR